MVLNVWTGRHGVYADLSSFPPLAKGINTGFRVTAKAISGRTFTTWVLWQDESAPVKDRGS